MIPAFHIAPPGNSLLSGDGRVRILFSARGTDGSPLLPLPSKKVSPNLSDWWACLPASLDQPKHIGGRLRCGRHRRGDFMAGRSLLTSVAFRSLHSLNRPCRELWAASLRRFALGLEGGVGMRLGWGSCLKIRLRVAVQHPQRNQTPIVKRPQTSRQSHFHEDIITDMW